MAERLSVCENGKMTKLHALQWIADSLIWQESQNESSQPSFRSVSLYGKFQYFSYNGVTGKANHYKSYSVFSAKMALTLHTKAGLIRNTSGAWLIRSQSLLRAESGQINGRPLSHINCAHLPADVMWKSSNFMTSSRSPITYMTYSVEGQQMRPRWPDLR